jgi:ABC-type dipeptide/oligopeptide/nickel transport system ATPase component
MAADPLLEVRDLKVSRLHGRSRAPIVEGVSLTLQRGAVLGLIGESGCGKSLTCLAILNLLPPGVARESGSIRLEGERVDGLAEARWRELRGRRMAVILQNPMSAFDPVLTIGEHFRETVAAHGGTTGKTWLSVAEGALHEVGLPSPRSMLPLYPFQMSGGMLQRVMIALALVHEAPLLIADEPTTDLDAVSQATILELLDGLRRERKMGILLVTHDLSVIARMADHVAVMRGGRMVEKAPVRDVFEKPAHPYTRALLDAHLGLYEERRSVSG